MDNEEKHADCKIMVKELLAVFISVDVNQETSSKLWKWYFSDGVNDKETVIHIGGITRQFTWPKCGN